MDKTVEEFLDLKVNTFMNKRNGQVSLVLPKKILRHIPKKLELRIPLKYLKQKFIGGN